MLARRLALLVLALGAVLIGFGILGAQVTEPRYAPSQELPLPLRAGTLAVRFVPRGLEPATIVDEQGTIYIGSIRGVPGGADMHRWSPLVEPPPNADATLPFKSLGQPDACGLNPCDIVGIAEGGGDMHMATNTADPATGIPNLAVTSQTLVPGETSMRSGDRGDTFGPRNLTSNPVVGEDREWMAAFGPSTVYMAVHDLITFNINVFRSIDGGQNYDRGYGQGIDPQTFPAAGAVGAQSSANIAGAIQIDQSSCPTRGNLYTIFVAPDSLVENAAGNTYRSIYVGVSTDARDGGLVYTFTNYKIHAQPGGVSAANLFPALAVDSFGHLYAVWSDNARILYSVSSDAGRTWRAPIAINTAETVGKSNVFPWVAADANGHVVVAWYGADRAGGSNDAAVMAPCPTDVLGDPASTTCMSGWAKWRTYVTETSNGHDAVPFWIQTVATDHIHHRGTISTGGLTGSANRDMGDFFTVALDRQHRANLAFGDDHLLDSASATNVDDPAARRKIRAYFTRRLDAPAVTTTGSCAGVVTGESGPALSGGGQLGDGVEFGVSVRADPLNGALQYKDDAAGIKVHSSNGVDSARFDGSCATATGAAKVNNNPGYRFAVTACDNGSPGAGADTLRIDVTGPNVSYSRQGVLTSGNLNRR